jgi:hypothetical protein
MLALAGVAAIVLGVLFLGPGRRWLGDDQAFVAWLCFAFLLAPIGAIVWRCPRCAMGFGRRLSVDVCPECGLTFGNS